MGDRRLGEEWTQLQWLKNDLLFAAASAGLWGAHRMSSEGRKAAGRFLGRCAASVLSGERRRAQARLRAVFGDRPPVTPHQVFETLGEDLGTTLSLLCPETRAREVLPLAEQARAVLDEKRGEGRGVIFVTAHLGPIDVMAASVAEYGYPVGTMARESYDPRFTTLYEELRRPREVRTFYRGRPGVEKAIIRALRDGMFVGFPMDLAGRGMATRQIPFLGEMAPLAVGPARLSRLLGVPVVVGTPAPTLGTLEITVEPLAVEMHPEPSEDLLLSAMARALERRIRAIPAHWPWMVRSRSVRN